MVQVLCHGNVESAIRVLKKLMQREGVFKEMKLRKCFENSSEKKKRLVDESKRRRRKLRRKSS